MTPPRRDQRGRVMIGLSIVGSLVLSLALTVLLNLGLVHLFR